MVFRITLVCDSRGTLLQHYFNLKNQWNTVSYKVVVLKGRTLWDLWKIACDELMLGKADKVYLLGGICNLTSPVMVQGIRFFWPRKSINNLAAELVQCQIDIYEEILLHQFKGKLVLIPEFGADLIKYNRIAVQNAWMQTCQIDLDYNLPLIHNVTKDLNKAMGVKTPWTLDVLYKTARNGVRYPRYSLLADGLHPTPTVAERIAHQILKDVDEFFEENLKVVFLYIPIPIYRLTYLCTYLLISSDCSQNTNVNSSIPFVWLGISKLKTDQRNLYLCGINPSGPSISDISNIYNNMCGINIAILLFSFLYNIAVNGDLICGAGRRCTPERQERQCCHLGSEGYTKHYRKRQGMNPRTSAHFSTYIYIYVSVLVITVTLIFNSYELAGCTVSDLIILGLLIYCSADEMTECVLGNNLGNKCMLCSVRGRSAVIPYYMYDYALMGYSCAEPLCL